MSHADTGINPGYPSHNMPTTRKIAYYKNHYKFFPLKKQVKNRRDSNSRFLRFSIYPYLFNCVLTFIFYSCRKASMGLNFAAFFAG